MPGLLLARGDFARIFTYQGTSWVLPGYSRGTPRGHNNIITISVNFKNYKHVILNNNSHESVGGQPTNADGINFKKLIFSIGYKNYFKINSKNNIKIIIKKFISSKGPSLLEVKIANGSLKYLLRPKNLLSIKEKFMAN